MTYWFLSFLWRRSTETSWTPGDAYFIDEHPLVYIRRLHQHYPNTLFKVMFFAEIPREVYELSRGLGG